VACLPLASRDARCRCAARADLELVLQMVPCTERARVIMGLSQHCGLLARIQLNFMIICLRWVTPGVTRVDGKRHFIFLYYFTAQCPDPMSDAAWTSGPQKIVRPEAPPFQPCTHTHTHTHTNTVLWECEARAPPSQR
jgi:hypothetical protein